MFPRSALAWIVPLIAVPTATADPFQPIDPPYGLLEMMEVTAEVDALGEGEGSEDFVYQEEGESWAREMRGAFALFDEISRDQIEDLGFLSVPTLDGAGYTPPARLARARLFNGFTPGRVPNGPFPTRSETIGPALATYFGRTTPGGLANQLTLAPGRRSQSLLRTQASSSPHAAIAVQHTDRLDKTLTYRGDLSIEAREGDESYARNRSVSGGGVFRKEWKQGFLQVNAGITSSLSEPGTGVPAVRPVPGAKATGPYIPLAEFNANGPEAFRKDQRLSLNISGERRMPSDWVLRTNTLAGAERAEEFRFRTGQFVLSQGVFAGTREPQFTEVDRLGVSQGFELIRRHEWLGPRQRLVAGIEGSYSEGSTFQRLLPQSLLSTLPAGMRRLDPANPDFSPVPYPLSSYTRVSTDQADRTLGTGIYAANRIALDRGRHYVSFGARYDYQQVEVRDRRPSANTPSATSDRHAPGAHLSWLMQVKPEQFSIYASWSTAFLPSSRVDIRRSRVVGSETTQGLEGGAYFRSPDGKWQATVNAHWLQRDDITRPNPLYNDPVADADRTQPQYLASGEERFIGGELAFSWRGTEGWRAGARWKLTRAEVTNSPDFPNEVGRQMAGVPLWTASLSGGRTFRFEGDRSLDLSLSATYTPDYVLRYEDRIWEEFSASEFIAASFNAAYRWQSGKHRHSLSASVRNPANQNLLERNYRLGQQRRLEASYTLLF